MTDKPGAPAYIEVGDLVTYHPSHPKDRVTYSLNGRTPAKPEGGDVGEVTSMHHLVGHRPYVVVRLWRTSTTVGALEEDWKLMTKGGSGDKS